MIKKPFNNIFITLILLVFFALSCSGKYFKADVKNEDYLQKIGCILIVPFANLSKSVEGGKIATELVSTALTSKPGS